MSTFLLAERIIFQVYLVLDCYNLEISHFSNKKWWFFWWRMLFRSQDLCVWCAHYCLVTWIPLLLVYLLIGSIPLLKLITYHCCLVTLYPANVPIPHTELPSSVSPSLFHLALILCGMFLSFDALLIPAWLWHSLWSCPPIKHLISLCPLHPVLVHLFLHQPIWILLFF